MTTTNTNNDVRSILLAALDLGAWQAEHLTGADLARQAAGLLAWYRQQLEATAAQAQRLACDVQELQGGEAWEEQRRQTAEMVRQVAAAAADLSRLEAALRAIDAMIGTSRFTPRDVRQVIADALGGPTERAAAGGPSPMVLDGED